MGWFRTWLIRFIILAVIGAGGGGLWYLNEWVSPERVREALLTALREKLPGVDVQVESAGLRLFGGVTVTNLKLTLPGETEPFFSAPSAVISHDKESLSQGRLELRKIELNDPTIRIVHKADGSWNVSSLMKSRAEADLPALPTLAVKNATVILTDERPDGLPPLVLAQLQLQLVNDPLALLKVDAGFSISPWVNGGPVAALTVPIQLSAKVNRLDFSFSARVEIPELTLSPELAPAIAKLDPKIGDYLSQCQAKLGIKAELKRDASGAIKHDVKVEVRDGRFDDEHLPWPLEQIHGLVSIKDGKIKVERSSARLGKAVVELSLETHCHAEPTEDNANVPQKLPAKIGASTEPLDELSEKLDKFTLNIRDLPIDDELFAKLPEKAHRTRRVFSPEGTVDISLSMSRTPQGMRQELEVRPNKASMNYEKFRYPIQELSGFVRKVSLPDTPELFRVQITGTAGGRRIELTGSVGTDGPDPLIDLKLTGIDIPIDDKLLAAMPKKYTDSLGKLHAAGRGDFSVEIRQTQGVNRCESTIRVTVHDGQVHYDHFPYPIRKIRGQVTIRITAVSPERPLRPGMALSAIVDTDRVELRNFEAVHGEGKLWLEGDSEPVFGSTDRKLKLRIQGENLPFDSDFKTAIQGLPIGDVWQRLSPRGQFTFGADVEVIERGSAKVTSTDVLSNPARTFVVPTTATTALPGEPPFQLTTDLKLTVNFKGPTITPDFFPYELEKLEGIVRYAGGQLELAKLKALHGGTNIALETGKIILADSGEIWAKVEGLQVWPFVMDRAILAALPTKMRDTVNELKVRGPMDLNLRELVLSVPKPLPAPPTNLTTRAPSRAVVARGQEPAKPDVVLFWNGELKLHGVSMDTGAAITDAHGKVAFVGKYDRDHLDALVGSVWMNRITMAKQPLTNVKFNYNTPAREPNTPANAPTVLQIADISGNAYQGTLGGEAWVSLGEQTQYRLWLTAAGVKLDELAATQGLAVGGELRGLAQAKVLLESKPDITTGQSVLTGNGQLDIPNGRLYNLPVLLPLLKLMKLQTPDQTAFEEAHALFTIVGDRVIVSQLDLIGTAVSLGGSGELDIRGEEVRFEFYTVWSQALKRWLTTPLGDMQSFLSGNLFRIDMVKQRGGVMDYRPQMLPVVTDPMKAVAERLRNRFGTSR